jgi:AraC-like DNA-binding protein
VRTPLDDGRAASVGASGAVPGPLSGAMSDAVGMEHEDVLVEWYRYPPGPAVELPRHAHADYQINLNLDLPAGVHYRGAFHALAPDSLAVIMPDEVHRPRDAEDRDGVSSHMTLYVTAETLREASGRRSGPVFRDLAVGDAGLVRRFARLHAALSGPAAALDRDVRLVAVLSELVDRHADAERSRPPHRGPVGHRAVRRAHDYLHEHVADNVTLADLAAVAGVSPFHLTRLFTAALGVPPHAYQVQLRVERAKRLVLRGRSVTDAGHEAGFFDLSHFSRHFKRYVGVAPGAYARLARQRPGRPARTYIRRRSA